MELRKTMENKVMEHLKSTFEAEDFSVIYTEKDEETPVNILSVLLPDLANAELMGEFCFLEAASSDENVYSFTSALHITEEMEEESNYLMYVAISELNWHLPYGAFVMNGPNLLYKYTALIPADLEETQMMDLCETAAGQTILFGSAFADILLDFSETHDLKSFRFGLEELLRKES